MTTKQVEKILSIEENYCLFHEELECCNADVEIEGHLFKYVDTCRPPNNIDVEQLIFSVDGETFAVEGYHSSWDGTEYDFSEVKKVKKTTIEMAIWK